RAPYERAWPQRGGSRRQEGEDDACKGGSREAARSGGAELQGQASQRALGLGPDLCFHVAGLCLRGVCDRRLQSADRGLARLELARNRPCARRLGASAL